MSGRGRGKRGISKGAREFEGAVYEIEFRENLPCGENRHRFMADFNRLVEKHLNYWEPWKIVKGEQYDHVWLKIKELWNIPNNDAKKTMRKKANHAYRQFKSLLTKKFVEKKNNNPKAKYSGVNMTRWDEFVVSRQSEEFKLKSAKAKASALQNKNPSRLGRTGLSDMEGTWRADWDQLVLQHPWLSVIQNDRSKIYALAHLPKDKTLGTRQLIESIEGILRQLVKGDKEIHQIVDVEAIQEKDPTPCDLLWPYSGHKFRIAIGKVYPTRDATLHGSFMSEVYIKVQVDTVKDAFKAIPMPKETESVHQLEQSFLEFIEWPRKKSSDLEIKFDWTLAKCSQQEGKWECGYYLMMFMHDLAINKQADFPESLWDNTRHLTPSEITQMAFMVLNEFYRLVVFPLDTAAPQYGGKTGGFDQITNKDAIMLYSLANGIHIDYANIFWEDIILKMKKKQREKVVPYTRFLSLLIMHKMKENYGIDEVTLYPTQIFSVNNWTLKPNQPEEPLFTAHMMAICALDKPVVFKAPKTSSRAESVSQGVKPRAKTGHKKPATSSKQPSVSSKVATKGRSSKAPTGSKTGHSKKRKESSLAMDSNPSRPSVSTPVDTEMHKEDQQATGGPTSLGVTSEERVNPQLSSSMSALNLNKPIFFASFIIHSESASGHDVSVDFIAEADPRLSAPNDSIPPQQGMDEGTKNTSYDHIFAGTDPHVLADQTKSFSERLETILTQPTTEKGASFTAIHGDKEEASTAMHGDKEEAFSTIKLEDLTKLASQIQPSFKDLDSPEDDHVIIVDKSDEDEPNDETKDTSVPRSSSPSISLPTELKDLPSKFNKLTEEIKGLKTQVHELEIELPKELKEIPTKLEDFTKAATSLTS
ncbi:ulp1 protease family, C-terminal catalytic domain-containing protein [Tanacetum coccineum]